MIKMAQFHIIKYLYEVEGLSQRKIANKLGISRNTVSKYLKSNQPPTIIQREKSYGKKEFSSETKRILPIIDQWLEEDFKRWGKQRHTAANIHRRLVREYGFKESESNIRKIGSIIFGAGFYSPTPNIIEPFLLNIQPILKNPEWAVNVDKLTF